MGHYLWLNGPGMRSLAQTFLVGLRTKRVGQWGIGVGPTFNTWWVAKVNGLEIKKLDHLRNWTVLKSKSDRSKG